MNSRIEHWQRTYRVRAPAAQRRLDALAAGAVLEAYHAGLHRAFGDAPGVVLVRRVGLRFAANLTGAAEGEFARRWGEAMAVAVARTVADDPGNGNVVRYSDEAAHLAAFLAEVAAGRAADEWFFARFAEYRRHSARETIAEALLARPDRRAAVLRRLSEAGALRCVLGLLDDRTLSRLWSDGAAATDAERPLFAAALSLLAALGAAPVGAPPIRPT